MYASVWKRSFYQSKITCMLQCQSNCLIQTGFHEKDLITNIEYDSLPLLSSTNDI